jgi:hypothetical protein
MIETQVLLLRRSFDQQCEPYLMHDDKRVSLKPAT